MVGYLDWTGWLDGITAFAIIVSSAIFGIICIVKGTRSNAKLLTYAGMATLCIGSFWLGPTVEFFMWFLLETHIYPYHIYGLFSYTMIGPGVLLVAILGGELIAPSKKKTIFIIMLIAGITFEIFLWGFTVESFKPFTDPEYGKLIDASFNTRFPTFFLIAFFLVYLTIFMATGFAIKAKKSIGELRKKFAYLAAAFYIFVITGIFDALIPIPIAIGIVRLVMCSFSVLMYLGLKT